MNDSSTLKFYLSISRYRVSCQRIIRLPALTCGSSAGTSCCCCCCTEVWLCRCQVCLDFNLLRCNCNTSVWFCLSHVLRLTTSVLFLNEISFDPTDSGHCALSLPNFGLYSQPTDIRPQKTLLTTMILLSHSCKSSCHLGVGVQDLLPPIVQVVWAT